MPCHSHIHCSTWIVKGYTLIYLSIILNIYLFVCLIDSSISWTHKKSIQLNRCVSICIFLHMYYCVVTSFHIPSDIYDFIIIFGNRCFIWCVSYHIVQQKSCSGRLCSAKALPHSHVACTRQSCWRTRCSCLEVGFQSLVNTEATLYTWWSGSVQTH